MLKKIAILFVLVLTMACGNEIPATEGHDLADCGLGYETLPGDGLTYCLPLDENQPVTIIINNVPDCNWETQAWSATDGCLDLENGQIVLECEAGEIPVDRNGTIECEYVGGCPEGYLVDIQGNDWTCIQQADPVEPECDEGYELFERDGVYYCRSAINFMCPDGYLPVTDGVTYVQCVQREDYDQTADYDRDGYSVEDGDCNDTRSDIHPGATEVCDGVDNNCDGHVDEGLIHVVYLDWDGDGFGSNQISTTRCSGNDLPEHFVDNSLDCDDNDATIHPGALEICGDGIDQDCDGSDIECQVPPTPRTQLTVVLAPGSPSNQGTPGFREVLRFNATADMAGDLVILGVTFRFKSTDYANTDWNACSELGNPARWAFIDRSDIGIHLDDNGDWSFQDANGWCDGDLDKVTLELPGNETNGSPWIGAGATKTFSVYFESFGASVLENDAIRLEIVNILWSDGVNHFHDTVRGLPLVGGTIVY